MPHLACWSCGRQVYTTAPLASLFAEERRCPRCGAPLHDERRLTDRREANRRTNPADDPGPPAAAPEMKGPSKPAPKAAPERRTEDRRTTRRRGGAKPVTPPPPEESGWRD